MHLLTRCLLVLAGLLGAGLLALSGPPVQAGPTPTGAAALRVQFAIRSGHDHLTTARRFLAVSDLPAMNVAIARGVEELTRVSSLTAGPVAETIAAVLADLVATDLSQDPELAEILLERGCADLAALSSTGRGVGPQSGGAGRIILNPPLLDYGLVCINEEHVLEVQVTNKSNVARTLSLRTTPSDPISLTGDSPTQVGAGETVTIKVKFETADAGRYRKAVMLQAQAPGESEIGVFLSVDASARLVLVDPDPLDFDEVVVGETATKNVTVRNCTDQEIMVTPNLPPFSFGFTVPGSHLPTVTIPAGGTVEVPLEFKPTTAREYRAVYRFSVPGPRGRLQVLGSTHVVGRGKEPVSLDTNKVNFGTVPAGQFHTRSFTIENNSAQPQEVEIDRARLDSEFWSVTPSGKVMLSPNSTRSITLRFGAIGRCQHRGSLLVKHAKLPRRKGTVAVNVLSR